MSTCWLLSHVTMLSYWVDPFLLLDFDRFANRGTNLCLSSPHH
uniref:Uncharacterized protein n=1 Tax=Arundo donax TaxID=35708 RepID=A0A0A9EFY3_ARUDO